MSTETNTRHADSRTETIKQSDKNRGENLASQHPFTMTIHNECSDGDVMVFTSHEPLVNGVQWKLTITPYSTGVGRKHRVTKHPVTSDDDLRDEILIGEEKTMTQALHAVDTAMNQLTISFS